MMNSAEARRIDSKWSSDLRVLSVRQPWAWLIVQGYKDIENRTWSTTYRGRLLIHASSKKPSLDLLLQVKRDFKLNLPECFDLGGIVGFADVVDCGSSSGQSSSGMSSMAKGFGRFGVVSTIATLVLLE